MGWAEAEAHFDTGYEPSLDWSVSELYQAITESTCVSRACEYLGHCARRTTERAADKLGYRR
jgi:hypothetical protein